MPAKSALFYPRKYILKNGWTFLSVKRKCPRCSPEYNRNTSPTWILLFLHNKRRGVPIKEWTYFISNYMTLVSSDNDLLMIGIDHATCMTSVSMIAAFSMWVYYRCVFPYLVLISVPSIPLSVHASPLFSLPRVISQFCTRELITLGILSFSFLLSFLITLVRYYMITSSRISVSVNNSSELKSHMWTGSHFKKENIHISTLDTRIELY